jgi:hypothetical protein
MNRDIQEELKSLAPTLAALPKEDRQAIPDGYMDTLEEQLLAQARLVSIETQTPSIDLTGLEDRILYAVKADIVGLGEPTRVIRWKALAVAASMALIMGTLILQKFDSTSTPADIVIHDEMVIEYLDAHQDQETVDKLIDLEVIDAAEMSEWTFIDESQSESPSTILESEINF